MEELAPGLWTWTAPHPSWTPEDGRPDGWERDVRSYALETEEAVVLFDPLVDSNDVRALAAGRPVVVLLTCRWHKRSSAELHEQLGATIRSPAEDAAELGLPVVPYQVGDDLPGDVQAEDGGYPNEATFWIPKHRALVTGDVFLGGERGFRVQPDSWLLEGLSPDSLRQRLRPLLHLPVELLLPTHGDPIADDARATLQRALET